MDLSILFRLLPAVVAGVLIAWLAVRDEARPGEVLDEALRALTIGLVAGRVAWLVLGGWDVLRTAPTTAILVRAGVETWIGIGAAGVLGARRLAHAPWLSRAVVPGALAGLATWEGFCGIEGLCAGAPVSWGVHVSGYASKVFPTSYVSVVIVTGLAALAWRWRHRPAGVATAAAIYAVVRGVLGETRAGLDAGPARDVLLSGVAAIVLGIVAWRLRDRPRTVVRAVAGADGVRLRVAEFGPRRAPAIVLGHGVGSSSVFLREAFLAPLLAAGWRVVTYDLRGHGASTPVPAVEGYAIDLLAADVAAVVASTRSVRVVGGVSLGGHAAATYLTGRHDEGARPEALAVVLPGWLGVAVRGDGPHAAVAVEVSGTGVHGMVARLRSDAGLPDWLRDTLVRDLSASDPDSVAAALVALDGADGIDVAALERSGVPVAVVGWPDDAGHPLAVAEELVQRLAGNGSRSALVTTTIAVVGGDRHALGAATVAALEQVDVNI